MCWFICLAYAISEGSLQSPSRTLVWQFWKALCALSRWSHPRCPWVTWRHCFERRPCSSYVCSALRCDYLFLPPSATLAVGQFTGVASPLTLSHWNDKLNKPHFVSHMSVSAVLWKWWQESTLGCVSNGCFIMYLENYILKACHAEASCSLCLLPILRASRGLLKFCSYNLRVHSCRVYYDVHIAKKSTNGPFLKMYS